MQFKSDGRMMSRVAGAGRGQNAGGFGLGDVSPRAKQQANEKDDLDFNSFNLGNGRLNEKKKRLQAYVQNIMNDKKNVKNCNETIRRILDNRQMKINRHEATMTLEGADYDYDDVDAQASLFYNNNFVQRNANIMPFFREHENEKRLAMVKIRDKLIELAKAKRLQLVEDARLKNEARNKKREEDKKARAQEMLRKVVLRQRQQACKYWLTFQTLN